MLSSSAIRRRTLPTDVGAYLREALGAEAQIRPWDGTSKLPYFLRDAFDLYELRLRDREILLASGRRDRMPKLSALRTQLDKLADIAERPVIFAVKTLASYERKRLVQQKIPFVVPGNQLYLPDLGIDFREYFRQPAAAVTALTPATQAMLIAALLRKDWQVEWQPAEVIAELGYTAMTLSRAVRELTGAGLATVRHEGRARWLQMKHPPAQTWEQATPFMRSPVKRNVWVRDAAPAQVPQRPLAGLSALAFYSMLTEPSWPVYAVSTAQWKAAKQAGVETTPEQQAGACQWQVWSYTPALWREGKTVDPLSLTLSLRDDSNERVQQALEDIRGKFPW
jgi:hypothetical protein